MMDTGILTALKTALEVAEKSRSEELKKLTPAQRELYNKYEIQMAVLLKAGDINGIKQLQKKFENLDGSI